MTSLEVIFVDIFLDCSSGLLDVFPFSKIHLFVFKTSEPALNHDVISPSAFTIHALTYVVFFKIIFVFRTGKLLSFIKSKKQMTRFAEKMASP